MRVVGAQKEEHNGDAEEKLLGGRILSAIVDLLPHVEVVVGARIEVEGDPAHPVEHDVRPRHVGDVCQRPGELLRDAGDDVEEDFEGDYEDGVDEPGACHNSSSISFSNSSNFLLNIV